MNERQWEIVHIPDKTHNTPQTQPTGKTQLSVILCPACENGHQLDSISNVVSELISSYQLSAFITKICKYAAVSKEEWEEQCKLWPTSYYPLTYNIEGITRFSEEDSGSVHNFMKLAVDMAKSGNGRVVNAAIIADPSTKQVIARACDQVHSLSPLINHTVAEQQEHTSYWHPLRHAAIVAIDDSAATDRRLFSGIELERMDYMQSSSVGSPAKRHRTIPEDVEHDEK